MDYTYEDDGASIKSYNSHFIDNTAQQIDRYKELDDCTNSSISTNRTDYLPEIYTNVPNTQSRPATSKKLFHPSEKNRIANLQQQNVLNEHICQIKVDSILKLKESTKKLLLLLEQIQVKSRATDDNPDDLTSLSKALIPTPKAISHLGLHSNTDIVTNTRAFIQLESETNMLDGIEIEQDVDNCSVYKRLTRKCYCLNRDEFNDFMMIFNEDTHFYTSNVGEIIKNMRLLKKFLYMNGGYTKNALIFLNESLSGSSRTEKVEITQGITHADICNVFEDQSVAVVCILWPCIYDYYEDPSIQTLAASFLYKLAELEEGRRYLNFSSKVANDIKKILRKKSARLQYDTIDTLIATLELLNTPLSQNIQANYYCKTIDEGLGNKTINDLALFRHLMTLEEVIMNLHILKTISERDNGKMELKTHFRLLLRVLRTILIEYDNSEINIVVINLLNNLLTKNVNENDSIYNSTQSRAIADTATEPIIMRSEFCQIPIKKCNTKKHNFKSKLKIFDTDVIHTNRNKSTLGLGLSPNRFRKQSRQKGFGWEPIDKSKIGGKGRGWEPIDEKSEITGRDIRSSIIVVPKEKKMRLV